MGVKLRSKKLSDGSQSLYLDIYFKGTRKYEFLNIKITKNDPLKKHKKELAEAKRSKTELELIANHYEIPKNFRGDDDFLDYFQSNVKDKSSKSTYKNFRNYIKEKRNQDRLPFRLLTDKLFNDYKDYLEKEFKNSTAWVYLLKLKTMLNKAVKEKLINTNPAKNTRIKLNEIQKVFLTEEEISTLINTESPDIEVKKAFLFACFTGLRISDITKLTWSQIENNKLYFRQTKTKGFEYLPLSDSALKFLYLNVDKEKVHPNEKIFKLGKKTTVQNKLRTWVKKSKIPKYLTFHSARHTFATMSLNSGIDIYTVSKMLGHKSIKTLRFMLRL